MTNAEKWKVILDLDADAAMLEGVAAQLHDNEDLNTAQLLTNIFLQLRDIASLLEANVEVDE